MRLRWQADRADALWHADVCHGPAMSIGGRTLPLRIHAILDDHSRYVVAIQAASTEREADMLTLMVEAMRGIGRRPDAIYLDNGATYTGDVLATLCARLEVNLLHAQAEDPQARGKMERFWRTLRDGMLNPDAPRYSVSGFMEGWRAIDVGRLKLIHRTDRRIQLFDLADDPGETRDVAPERPIAVRYARGLLGLGLAEAELPDHRRVEIAAERLEIDETLRRQLEELGYAGASRPQAPPEE